MGSGGIVSHNSSSIEISSSQLAPDRLCLEIRQRSENLLKRLANHPCSCCIAAMHTKGIVHSQHWLMFTPGNGIINSGSLLLLPRGPANGGGASPPPWRRRINPAECCLASASHFGRAHQENGGASPPPWRHRFLFQQAFRLHQIGHLGHQYLPRQEPSDCCRLTDLPNVMDADRLRVAGQQIHMLRQGTCLPR